MTRKVKVEILMGLPGSGKTYYAESEKQDFLNKDPFSEEEFEVIHFDAPRFTQPQWFVAWRDRLILDGLFLNTDDVIKVIKECKEKAPKAFTLDITIIWWKENRDICLHNDNGRRNVDSKTTIKNAKYEYPDISRIKKETGLKVEVIEKEVVKKPDILGKLSEETKRALKGGYLKSESWVISGESKSYDGEWNHLWSAMGSDEVPEFEELYIFLEEICPTLTFLDSRRIFKDFVSVRTYEDNDYYSHTTNGQYICNINKTLEYLTQKGYFKKEEK